ncbi:Zn-ribbon domain-containing OB-fold protein, partial [Streptomyces sp. SID10244]|nr:Zn-ribbon domain-containing OB-fold protein [Streptomyces sp. SID10244]
VDSPGDISTGLRVHAVWRPARIGRIDDIAYFAPGESGDAAPANEAENPEGDLVVMTTPITTEIAHSATEEESWYLEGLKAGKLYGSRIGSGVDEGRVYFPPRKVSPADGAAAAERVELGHTGIVTTFCIVNVPFQGQRIKPPYVAAYVLLDGSDIPFLHLILDCAAEDVRMGMRVKAVWLPEDEWDHSIGNISHFAPTGEPDAEYETYRDHL